MVVVDEMEMGVRAAAQVRVARGARWLDENFPDWDARINIHTLDLADGEKCICGQVFTPEAQAEAEKPDADRDWEIDDGYMYATKTLFTEANSWITGIVRMKAKAERSTKPTESELAQRASRVAVALGFNNGDLFAVQGVTDSDRIYVDFDDLQDAWTALLDEREHAKVNA